MVQFVIERDDKQYFKFASLQSKVAKTMLTGIDIDFEAPQSLVLLDNGIYHQQSTAALRIAKNLGGLWSWLYVFIIIPKPLRDMIYRWIAKNRYKWFGKQESCWVPTLDLKSRFIGN